MSGANLKSRLAKLFRKPSPVTRESVAARFVRGEGIEIGALQNPLALPPGARAAYVDRASVAELREHYPELNDRPLTEPDVIDDGERLDKFADASLDFIVANHFLEHCQDPIGATINFMRALRPGGVAFLAVPDKRFTFDRDRAVTTLDHLVRDHREGPARSRRAHYEEWIRIVNKVEDDAWAENRIAHYMATDYSIHFHVWTEIDLRELLAALQRDFGLPFDVEFFALLGDECVMALRKRAEIG